MSSINHTSAARFNTFSLTDNLGNSYFFVRSLRKQKGFFNIAKCEVLIDGKVPDRDGLVPDAVFFTNEQVADLITQSEAHTQRLENVQSSLEQWIDLRCSRSRKAKQGKLRLQKKEVST